MLPDGCIDVIWISGLPPIVAGPATTASMPETAAGTEIVGVRFRPGVAPHLLGVGAQELLNRHIALRAIWRHERTARWEDAMARPTLSEKLESMAEVITAHAATVDEPDALVSHVVACMATHPRGTVTEIAQRSGFGERQMRRRFVAAVGYGPKTLQRILRMQRLLWLASRDAAPRRNLAGLAFAAGYADQPHMTREVRALTGASPGQLLHDEAPVSALSDLFKTSRV